jgi:hypothetical protein
MPKGQKIKEILDIRTNTPGTNVFPWSMVNVRTYSQLNDFNELMHAAPELLFDVRKIIEVN